MSLLHKSLGRSNLSSHLNSTSIQSHAVPRRRMTTNPTTQSPRRHLPLHRPPHAAEEDNTNDNNNDNTDLAAARQSLESMMSKNNSINGTELRELVYNKFNRSYDIRIQKRGRRMYLHIMWKYLEQQSFALTEEEYQMQLDAVAEYLTLWGVVDIVKQGITTAKYAPGMTIGGGAKAVSIPLGVEIGSDGRSGEWNRF